MRDEDMDGAAANFPIVPIGRRRKSSSGNTSLVWWWAC
jgi:hypothetical protein